MCSADNESAAQKTEPLFSLSLSLSRTPARHLSQFAGPNCSTVQPTLMARKKERKLCLAGLGARSEREKKYYLRGNHPQPIQHALFSPLPPPPPPPPPPPRRYKTGRRLRRRQISITVRRAGGASWIILDSLLERVVEILQSTKMRFARWKEAERRRRRAILLCGFDSASCASATLFCHLPPFLPFVSLVSMSCLFPPTDRDRLQYNGSFLEPFLPQPDLIFHVFRSV